LRLPLTPIWMDRRSSTAAPSDHCAQCGILYAESFQE
jgi:hypothetical protein